MTPEWPFVRITETATGKVIAVMPQGTIMTNPHWLEEMYGLTYEDVTVDIINNQQEEEQMTDNNDPWADFNAPMSGDFPDAFKFDTVGVSIAGTITNVRKAEFDGKGVPELWIQTDNGERSVLCGQANLMTQLIEHRPLVGDRIAIVYTGQRKAKLGMAKLFDVVVKRDDGSAPTGDIRGPAAKTAADLL